MDNTSGGWRGKANSNVSVCRIVGDDPARLDGATVHALNREDEFGPPGGRAGSHPGRCASGGEATDR
jgi:hypothetical protein